MSERNQNQIRQNLRPTGRERAYRRQTIVSLERDQVRWDVADTSRREPRIGGVGQSPAEIRRTDYETGVRLAYLATADGSVSEWERSRTRIVAEYLLREDALSRRGPREGVFGPAVHRKVAPAPGTPGVANSVIIELGGEHEHRDDRI